jgi:hypothetical protein
MRPGRSSFGCIVYYNQKIERNYKFERAPRSVVKNLDKLNFLTHLTFGTKGADITGDQESRQQSQAQ